MTQTTEIPTGYETLAAEILAHDAALRARFAAENYSRRVSLRRGTDEVIITVNAASSGVAYEITGCSFDHGHGGNSRAGDVQTRYKYSLADAKAYANGWASSFTAKGYRVAEVS